MAARRLADRGERLGQKVVDRLPARETLAEDLRAASQLVVGERLGLLFERVDLLGDLSQSAKLSLVGVEESGKGAHGLFSMGSAAASATRAG